jgi:primosomal replication protein N
MIGVRANRVEISGLIVENGGLRRTPSGMPVLQIRLKHASEQEEAGKTRKVECEMAAQAFGDVATRLADFPNDRIVNIAGFLDRTSARNLQPMLHITEFELL